MRFPAGLRWLFLVLNFKKFKNRYGWTLRAEYTPVPYIVIDGRLSNDTKPGSADWGMTVAFRLPLGKRNATVTLDSVALMFDAKDVLKYLAGDHAPVR